jgi:hypothetical protein
LSVAQAARPAGHSPPCPLGRDYSSLTDSTAHCDRHATARPTAAPPPTLAAAAGRLVTPDLDRDPLRRLRGLPRVELETVLERFLLRPFDATIAL